MSYAVGLVEGVDGASRRPAAGMGAVRLWLFGMVALVMLMVAIGGATRLTGSGLSITEWKPVTGAIPPVTDAAWAMEFEKYRASSQYRNLNRGMALGEFKTIYWWEWSHRQLGRFLGLYFFLPLAMFWWRGRVTTRLALGLIGIGALGGLQAAVGWIMVASGLEPGMTAVAPLKLMLHLVIASVILALIVWVASGLDRPDRPGACRGIAAAALGLSGSIVLQIALGGLVAGSRAGWTYNTWPLMDGRLLPDPAAMFSVVPWVENFLDNPLLVQFNHRLVAYAIVLAAVWHAVAARSRGPAGGRAAVVAGLALAQAALGIVTLLLVVPLWAGLAHQLLAMILLVASVHHARRSGMESRLFEPQPS